MQFTKTNFQDLLFDVEMTDTLDVSNIPANSEYMKTIIGHFDNGDRILNVCSERYRLIPNREIFPPIREMLATLGISFREEYQISEDRAMFHVAYILEDERFMITLPGGDKIQLQIVVTHSYNGLLKYKILLGFYRLICSNGMVIPLEQMKKFNLFLVGKHTEKINTTLSQFRDKLTLIFANPENIREVAKMYEVLAGKTVIYPNLTTTIEKVAKGAGIPIKKGGKSGGTIEYVRTVVSSERTHLNLTNPNLWLIYNGFNRYIYDNDLNNANPDKRMIADEKLLKTTLSLV